MTLAPRQHTLRWDAEEAALHPVAALQGDLLAADSFLVVDGSARGTELHWRRFRASCRSAGLPAHRLDAFHSAVDLRIGERSGRWFPRIELRRDRTGEPRLTLLDRPAPDREATARVWTLDPGDPRRQPHRKGPDLEIQHRLRAVAEANGADEALILDAEGSALEGAYSSLLWWDDGRLCTVPTDAPILDGVTRRLVLDMARRRGIPVEERRPRPEELGDLECWLTSSLHGIRAVAAWYRPHQPAGRPARSETWQRELEGLAVPLLRPW